MALAQANAVLAQCRAAFPALEFELKIIKTTGDKLQTASLANPAASLPKGLFTKELEVALLQNQADIAVHSLKDLPTELPDGLTLGAVGKRADVREILVYRDAKYLEREKAKVNVVARPPGGKERRGFTPHLKVTGLPAGATVATSSTRRKAHLLAMRKDLHIVEIRGNVATRLQKLAEQPELDATILAAAGLQRLAFEIHADGRLLGPAAPDGLLATTLEPSVILPCVGQGALGIETRRDDARIAPICERLNDYDTQQCVTAERAFLRAMGGGCQSPVAAYAEIENGKIHLRAAFFTDVEVRRAEGKAPITEAAVLGEKLAAEIKSADATPGSSSS